MTPTAAAAAARAYSMLCRPRRAVFFCFSGRFPPLCRPVLPVLRRFLQKAGRGAQPGGSLIRLRRFAAEAALSSQGGRGCAPRSLLCAHSAFLGQFFTHSRHRIHSVPFFLLRELSVTSTPIGQTRLHLPQLMHFSLSHVTRNSEK